MPRITRRTFLQDSTLLATSLAAAEAGAAAPGPEQAAAPSTDNSFHSRWTDSLDRVWLGPAYWANPLQDWRLAGGRIECIQPALDRNVQLLTRQLGPQSGTLEMSVRLGRVGGGPLAAGKGSAGFRIGIRGSLDDYRHALIFGSGIDAGLTSSGGLFLGQVSTATPGQIRLDAEAIELRLTVEPTGDDYKLSLAAYDPAGKLLGQVSREHVPPEQILGNLGLVANFGKPQPRAGGNAKPKQTAGAGRFWFADWQIGGSKLTAHDERAYGPILFSHYTLSAGVLKLTAQMPPVGAEESQTVRLQVRHEVSAEWSTMAEEPIHPQARTSTFRIANWPDTRDVAYRLAYTLADKQGHAQEHTWTGTVRRDPVDKPVLTVGDVSCNIHAAFPNTHFVSNMAALDPDLLAFVGDQFYESTGGYGTIAKPTDLAILDYLRKWCLHGWTWRELTRDRPSVSLPDDHDVYQGNIWGEAGEARHGTQEMGGYDMPAEWVNVVHRTQTSHHPDAYDPAPIKQDISVYYGPLVYGRVSFAVIADRMFKTGPEGKVPPTGGRGDHVKDPNFDPRSADLPGFELLGERQMKFLRAWAADWRGADMKAVISQTIFTSMATTHGANRERLRADYDTNGWPQTPRNEALREIRKAFAFHIAGDQHLPAVVQYGIDSHRDGPVAFAGPAVNVGYPRWWEPEESGQNRAAGAPENTGDFTDHFGNPMTVLAVANGAIKPRTNLLESVHDKASGLGLVRFDKRQGKITLECWPYLADVTQPGTQFAGWPLVIDMLDNYARPAQAWLPTLDIEGPMNPVVQVVREDNGEIVYTLRIRGQSFQPKVFSAGSYTVRVSEPDTGRMKELRGLAAAAENAAQLAVKI